MMRLTLFNVVFAGLVSITCTQVDAKSAEENYQAKCSVCHDGGAGQAPRITDTLAWTQRAANGLQALYTTALKGKPNTAMAAKGGYAELSDQEVRSIVDYMLKISGNNPALLKEPTTAAAKQKAQPNASLRKAPSETVTTTQATLPDLEVSKAVAERLRKTMGTAKTTLDEYEGVITVRGVGIKVQTEQGVTTLFGSVKEGEQVAKAESIATVTSGVKRVVNKLIAASVFEWD